MTPMPPETQTTPPSEPAKAPFHKTTVGLITFLVLLCGAAAALWWFGLLTPKGASETSLPVLKGLEAPAPGTNDARVAEIARLMMVDNFPAAIAAYDALMQDASMTAEQRARATLYVSGARYSISGNVQDLVADIKEMKKHALNPEVSVGLRVNLVNNIGTGFGTREKEIFDAIYSGPIFENFRVDGDGTLSGRKLYEWSYSLEPTAHAAVRIARWYIETSLFQKPVSVPRPEVIERVQTAIKYMNESKVLEGQERTRFDNIENSPDHLFYVYWYALESGYLARIRDGRGGEPYAKTYKQAWAAFFAEAARSNSHSKARKLMPYAHYFFANALFKVDKDKVAAAAELDKAIDAVNSDPNPETNLFTTFVKNDGIWVGERAYMRGMSDKFDAFLDSLGK